MSIYDKCFYSDGWFKIINIVQQLSGYTLELNSDSVAFDG